MTLLSRLIALERRPTPPPVRTPEDEAEDAARRVEFLALLCAIVATDGPDHLRELLTERWRDTPELVDGYVRLTTMLVRRARNGESLNPHQRQVLARAGILKED